MPVTAIIHTPKGPIRVRGSKAEVDKYVEDLNKAKTGSTSTGSTGPTHAPIVMGSTGTSTGASTGASITGSMPLSANGAGVIIVSSIMDAGSRKATAVLLFKYKGENTFKDIGQDADSLSDSDMIIAAKQGARLGSVNVLNFDSYNIEKTRKNDITYVDYKSSGFTHRTFFVGVSSNIIHHHYFFANKKMMEFVMTSKWDRCDEMKWFLIEDLKKCTGTGDVSCKDINGNASVVDQKTIESIRTAVSSTIIDSVAKSPAFASDGYDRGFGDISVRGTNTIIFSHN